MLVYFLGSELCMIEKDSNDYNRKIYKYERFEQFVLEMFQKMGYKKISNDTYADFLFEYNDKNEFRYFACEVKYSSSINLSRNAYVNGVKCLSSLDFGFDYGKLILITNALCSESLRKEASEKNVIIFDLSNFLYVLYETEFYQEFLEFLEFAINDITAIRPLIPFSLDCKQNHEDNSLSEWQKKFFNLPCGKRNFAKYERYCISALKEMFSNDLSNWQEQYKSNDDLYRFDLICKTKSNTKEEFFWTINNYFNTRYIIFEFKNYSEKITQKEIFTTEKYLYNKALRNVAIIISRNGIDENGLKAIKGSIREQGKVIISLTDNDILNMLEKHYNGENPAIVLSEKLDELLMELEK